MTITTDFEEKKTCKPEHFPITSSSTLCDWNNKVDILKVLDTRPNTKYSCQKQITHTSTQNKIVGSGFKKKTERKINGTEKAWNKIWKPAPNATAPFFHQALASKTKAVRSVETWQTFLNQLVKVWFYHWLTRMVKGSDYVSCNFI